MMMLSTLALLLAMTSADAVAILLNSPSATSKWNYSEAFELVKAEAEAGKPLQQFVLGITLKEEDERARRYREASRDKIKALAANKDNPLAWYLLSVEKNDLRLLKRAAYGENVQALNALGALITTEALNQSMNDTNRLERALAKSFEYFHRAAAKRDPNGFINLGTCYLRGFGCRQDMALAFQCFMAAAEAGHPEGMDNVSACYQFGHGIEPDAEQSLLWAMRARSLRGDQVAAKWLQQRQ